MRFDYDAAMGAGGPCVVRRMRDGSLMAVCECLTMEAARMEAMRLNSVAAAQLESPARYAAKLAAMRGQAPSERTTRAGVRFFPNEG